MLLTTAVLALGVLRFRAEEMEEECILGLNGRALAPQVAKKGADDGNNIS